MSKETLSWLNNNTLIGFTSKRGNAWHYKAEEQGAESNHYELAIPVGDVERRLFPWTAEECQITAVVLGADGTHTYLSDDRKAIVRPAGTFGDSDKGQILGVFKDGYCQHSYAEWLLQISSNILGDTLSVSSAGLLKGGAVGWVEISVPDTIKTPEGVEFRPNLLAATSLDGSLATVYKRTITNTVCDNTLAAGLGELGQQFKVKHSRKSLGKLDDARKALSLVEDTADDFAEEVKVLCATTVTDQQWFKFLDAYAAVGDDASDRSKTIASNKIGDLKNLYRNDNRVAPWAGTAFGVLQAVNTWEHHLKTVRGAQRIERNQLRTISGDFEQVDVDTIATLNKVLVNA